MPSRQRGVSMLELLVSLLIFTFGMLGLAGLQTRTLTFNQSSLFRSQATALTDDVLDRMRSDRKKALSQLWDTAITAKTATMPNTTFPEKEMKDWKAQVEGLLPSGRASVVTNTAAGTDFGTVTITIEWDDSRGADAAQTFVTKTKL
jgi:type IV pilus assembly protein PilV